MGTRSRRRRRTPNSLPWYEQRPWEANLVRNVLKEFPWFTFENKDGKAFLDGRLSLGGSFVRVRVLFGDGGLQEEPSSWDQDSIFPQTADYHKIPGSDRLCIWFPPESEWVPSSTGLKNYLNQLVVHVDRQLRCEADPQHRWPGPSRPHGHAGASREFLEQELGVPLVTALSVMGDNPPGAYEPCPCRSGRKWRWCHRNTVSSIRKRYRGRLPFAENDAPKVEPHDEKTII